MTNRRGGYGACDDAQDPNSLLEVVVILDGQKVQTAQQPTRAREDDPYRWAFYACTRIRCDNPAMPPANVPSPGAPKTVAATARGCSSLDMASHLTSQLGGSCSSSEGLA